MNFEIGKAITATAVLGALGVSLAVSGPSYAAGKGEVARGKYVVTIGGCNDCHTAGYAESDGKVPEKDWLTGSPLGWRGGWGTTYAVNLRNYIDKMTEKQWLAKAKTLQARPPMPAMNVRAMTEADLKAVYHFVKSLGPTGQEAPAYLPPDKMPNPPFVQFPGPPPSKS